MGLVNDVLVIIPTYNEKENIEGIINAVLSLEDNFDILIIDDGSPDGTGDIVKRLQKDINFEGSKNTIHLLERQGKLGLGTAYIAGFKFALAKGYEFICEMDADFSHNPKDLPQLYRECKDNGADLTVGSRYINGVNVVNWPIGRVIMSYFAGVYVRFVTGIPVMDATAGFVCYSKEVLQTIDLDKIKFIGYAFQIEMKFTAWKFGFRIKEHSIIFTDRTLGKSKMSGGIFKEAFFGVVEMKIRSLFRKYLKPA